MTTPFRISHAVAVSALCVLLYAPYFLGTSASWFAAR